MQPYQILNARWEDVLFQRRNKSYGAYILRVTSDRRTGTSMLIGISLFLLLIYTPRLAALLATPGEDAHPTIVIVSPMNVSDLPAPIKRQDQDLQPKPLTAATPPPAVRGVQFTPPAVRSDQDLEAESTFATIDELRDREITASGDTLSSGSYHSGLSGDPAGIGTGLDGSGDAVSGGEGGALNATTPEEKIFVRVDQMPQFGSGERELLRYLAENIRYPAIARDNRISGTVIVQFVIGSDGSVINPVIARSIGGGCDEEALRVIREMPRWSPGRQQGRPVSVKFTLPVHFRLQ